MPCFSGLVRPAQPTRRVLEPCQLEGSGHSHVILGLLSMRVLIHWTFNPGLFNLVLPAPGRSLYRWAQSTSAWSTGGLNDPPSYVDTEGLGALMSRKTFLELRIRGFEGRPEEIGNLQVRCPSFTHLAEARGRQQGLSFLFFFLVAQARSFIFYFIWVALGPRCDKDSSLWFAGVLQLQHMACGILVPLLGSEPVSLASEGGFLMTGCWITREIPAFFCI